MAEFSSLRGERGEGRLGLLFSLFVLASVGYFIWQSAPRLVSKVQMEDATSEIVKMAVLRNFSEAEVRQRLTGKASELEIPPSAYIEVRRKGKMVTATVSYTQDIVLPFYTYAWPVNIQVTETGF